MVFVKKNVSPVSCKIESNDADECKELLVGLDDLLDIDTGLENVKCATSAQTAAKNNEDRERADALGMPILGSIQLQTNS